MTSPSTERMTYCVDTCESGFLNHEIVPLYEPCMVCTTTQSYDSMPSGVKLAALAGSKATASGYSGAMPCGSGPGCAS